MMDNQLISDVLIEVMGCKKWLSPVEPNNPHKWSFELPSGEKINHKTFNDWNAAGMVIEKMRKEKFAFKLLSANYASVPSDEKNSGATCSFKKYGSYEKWRSSFSSNPIEAIFKAALQAISSE